MIHFVKFVVRITNVWSVKHPFCFLLPMVHNVSHAMLNFACTVTKLMSVLNAKTLISYQINKEMDVSHVQIYNSVNIAKASLFAMSVLIKINCQMQMGQHVRSVTLHSVKVVKWITNAQFVRIPIKLRILKEPHVSTVS